LGVLWSLTVRSLGFPAILRRGHVHDQAHVEGLESQKRSDKGIVAAPHVKDVVTESELQMTRGNVVRTGNSEVLPTF
jgi:hypothetical protein